MDIVDMLSAERELLTELLNVIKMEKKVLIKDDIKALNEIVKIKQDLKNKIAEMEKDRINMYGGLTLKELLPKLNQKEREEAELIGKDMENMVYGIQEINNTNRQLINQSLKYIRSLINIVVPRRVAVYKQSGRIEDSSITSSILNKSI
jgi:hypothetical protein